MHLENFLTKKKYKNSKADKAFAIRHDVNIGLGININSLKKYLKKNIKL
jgi:hypothetical protein